MRGAKRVNELQRTALGSRMKLPLLFAFDVYDLVFQIGEGGMGLVFLASDRKLGRKVALKRMRAEIKVRSDQRESFIREAKIISHLNHPYIVGVHEIVEDEGELYLVLDYVEGLPLSQIIAERKNLPFEDSCNVLAGLILFGTQEDVRKYLPQAEIIFEYRSSEAAGPAAFRKDYRQGFFAVHQDIWERINLRNDAQHYQDGLFVLDIATFDERTVREAVLNAVAHRDYQMGGSIFIRQHQRHLVVENPGGLPLGVTPENIIDRQAPRNRLIMDILLKCGLVEKSGQGVDLMFERSIQQGKLIPDFVGTDRHHVKLTLYGQVRDERFLRFLEKVGKEKQLSFGTQDLLVLDLVHRERPVPEPLEPRLQHLVEQGVVERFGRGKGTRYILSRRFYAMAEKKGVYTRKRGLDRATNKELLLKHIKENVEEGSRLRDLLQVLPGLTRFQVQRLLREIQEAGSAYCVGSTRSALWYPGPKPANVNEKGN